MSDDRRSNLLMMKFLIHVLGYISVLVLKSSVNVFSIHFYRIERAEQVHNNKALLYLILNSRINTSSLPSLSFSFLCHLKQYTLELVNHLPHLCFLLH